METQHRHVPLALIQYLGHIADVALKLTFGNSVKLISLHKLSSDFDTNIDNIQKNYTVKLSRSVQSSRDHRYSAPTVWLPAAFKSENIVLTFWIICCDHLWMLLHVLKPLLKLHWLWKFWYSEFQGKTSLTTYLIWGQLIIFHGMTFPPFLALLEAPLVIGL